MPIDGNQVDIVTADTLEYTELNSCMTYTFVLDGNELLGLHIAQDSIIGEDGKKFGELIAETQKRLKNRKVSVWFEVGCREIWEDSCKTLSQLPNKTAGDRRKIWFLNPSNLRNDIKELSEDLKDTNLVDVSVPDKAKIKFVNNAVQGKITLYYNEKICKTVNT
jgi:hypothetical protein